MSGLFKLENLRIILDIAVILLMILALRSSDKAIKVAQNANEIAFESVKINYMPFVKLTHFTTKEFDNNYYDFIFYIKNYATNSPAINLKMKTVNPKVTNENYTFVRSTLMPNDSLNHTLSFHGIENSKIVKNICNGTKPLRISIEYFDVYNQKYKIEQEIRNSDGTFRNTDYKIIEFPLRTIISD